MTIFVSHSSDFDYAKELYAPIQNSNLYRQHQFIFPHEKSDNPYPTKQFFASAICDLVIAEVSYPSTGQGIELGWADTFAIPIVCIYKDGAEISSSLSLVSNKFLMYTDLENMTADISGVLKLYE